MRFCIASVSMPASKLERETHLVALPFFGKLEKTKEQKTQTSLTLRFLHSIRGAQRGIQKVLQEQNKRSEKYSLPKSIQFFISSSISLLPLSINDSSVSLANLLKPQPLPLPLIPLHNL